MLLKIELAAWIVAGLCTLCSSNVSKLSYGLLWFCMILKIVTDIIVERANQ